MEVSGRRGDDGGIDSKQINFCDPCTILNKNENAKHYCVDCNEYFCDNCCTVHKVSKLSKTHKFLSREEMPRQKLQSSDQNICTEHGGKMLECYCKIHNDFLCTVCVTLFHKECTVDYIDTIANDFDKSTEYTFLMNKISVLTQRIQNLKTKAVQNRQDIHNFHEQLITDVKTFREEINSLLDSMENDILTKALGLKKIDLGTVDFVSTKCDNMATDLLELSSNMDNQKKYKQQRQLVISAKKAQTKVKEYENKMSDLSHRNQIKNYTFQRNDSLVQSLQIVDSLGKIEDTGTEKGRTIAEQELSVTHDPKSVRAKYLEQINVKSLQDTHTLGCCITGSEMLDENRIVLVDYNNSSVTVVDVLKDEITSCIKVPTQPWDVARIDDHQLVVTRMSTLVFLKMDPILTVNKEIKVGGDCGGIIFHDNKLIVAFVEPEPEIKLISLSGDILRTFRKDKNGKNLFKYPWHITLSYDKSTLFVSDRDNNRVTSLNHKGEEQHVYTDNKLNVPCGLTADIHGNIYVAGRASNNIHQISTQCRPIQILQDDTQGMKCPQSVLYCETGHKLYIGHFESNFLSVYQLQ